MHTTESRPSHLRSVRELLAKLDDMKNTGVVAAERLEFILDSGSDLVDEFNIEDAFDLEARARTRRLESLGDMKTNLRQGQEQWRGAPLREDVKEAAGRLFGHLDRFLENALTKERKSEIEMLSQIWEWGPDISHLFPGLTSGRPKPEPLEIPAELQEFTQKKAALYEEVRAEAEAHPHHCPVPGPQPCPVPREEIDEVVDQFVEDNPGMTLTELNTKLEDDELEESELEDVQEPGKSKYEENLEAAEEELKKAPTKKFPFIKTTSPVSAQEEGTVVGTVSTKRDAWTSVLREMTADEWERVQERKGQNSPFATYKNSIMLWYANACEARLELQEEGDGLTLVNLRMLLRGRLHQLRERMTTDQVSRLHLDPMPFVKSCLAS
jgi:hypothetical protein